MALDLVIGEADSPKQYRVFETEFEELVAAVTNSAPLLTRIRDYYDDVRYEVSELPSLISEIQFLLESPLPKQGRRFAEQLLSFAEGALRLGEPVHLFAD